MSKRELHKIGHDAFLVGIMLAIVVGAAADLIPLWTQGYIVLTLMALGIIVGLITIPIKEEVPFLIAVITLIIGAAAAPFTPLNWVINGLGVIVNNIFKIIAAFVLPAAVIVAIKAVYVLAK